MEMSTSNVERKSQLKSISQVDLESEQILTGQTDKFYSDLLVSVLSINPNGLLYYLSCN